VISTDSHAAKSLTFMKYGVKTARRGWIEKSDVINTLPLDQFLDVLRPKPHATQPKAAKKKQARK